MGGKQSTAGRPRGAFPGVSTDDSAVPPSAHFGHYRPSGTMGLRSRSVSSVAGMGIEHSPAVPFGFYTPRGTDSDRAGGGSAGTTAAPHGTGYQDTGGGGHHTDGVLYLGSRGSLADTLPLHIAPRWFSAHSALTGSQQENSKLDVNISAVFSFPTSPSDPECAFISVGGDDTVGTAGPAQEKTQGGIWVCRVGVASSELVVAIKVRLAADRAGSHSNDNNGGKQE
ncbi:E3 ubiquitin-protein ligase znrf1, partial [Centroberyx affinis]|uniref:E3 ubiquitin-protein ligase znrf1 n=1 Tax=Centroberyx affinis TaxID=166261 RepID=UPI003A5C366F